MLNRKFNYLLASLLSIIFLLPLLYLNRYAVFQMDDFCRAGINPINFFSSLKSWYLYHNGRYFNALLSLLPVYNTTTYRIILAFIFLLFSYSISVLFKSLFQYFKICKATSTIFFLSVISLIVILALLPDINQFLYWYAAASVYEFSAIAFILFVVLLLKFWFKNKLDFFSLGFIIIVLNGNSELLVGITNFLLLSVLVFETKRNGRVNFKLLVLNLISWVTSFALILAPGMTARREQFNYGGDFIGSVKVAVIYGAKFIAVSMLDVTNIIFFIFLFLIVLNLTKGKTSNLPVIQPIILLIISYVSIISIVFILYYAMGTFNSEGGWRATNLLKIVAFTFYLINLINLVCYLKNNQIGFNIPYYIFAIIFAGLLLSLTWNKNYTSLATDLFSGKYDKFDEQFAEREKLIRNTNGSELILPLIKSSKFLNSGDSSLKTDDWVKECYLHYINENYDKGFKSIKIISD